MLTCLTVSLIMLTCFLCMPCVSVSCLQLCTVCSQSIKSLKKNSKKFKRCRDEVPKSKQTRCRDSLNTKLNVHSPIPTSFSHVTATALHGPLSIHIYYCTSESEIWLDIARVGRCIYTNRRRVKMLPTSAISSHFSLSRVQ